MNEEGAKSPQELQAGEQYRDAAVKIVELQEKEKFWRYCLGGYHEDCEFSADAPEPTTPLAAFLLDLWEKSEKARIKWLDIDPKKFPESQRQVQCANELRKNLLEQLDQIKQEIGSNRSLQARLVTEYPLLLQMEGVDTTAAREELAPEIEAVETGEAPDEATATDGCVDFEAMLSEQNEEPGSIALQDASMSTEELMAQQAAADIEAGIEAGADHPAFIALREAVGADEDESPIIEAIHTAKRNGEASEQVHERARRVREKVAA